MFCSPDNAVRMLYQLLLCNIITGKEPGIHYETQSLWQETCPKEALHTRKDERYLRQSHDYVIKVLTSRNCQNWLL